MEMRNTGSWTIALPMTAVLIVLGMITGADSFFAAAVIPIVFMLVASLSSVPSTDSISIEREIETEAPSPGNPVEVHVTVRNTGDRTITDCRVVDAVPSELAVIDGSPRAALALTPGAESTFSYTVTARRGDHRFGDADVEVRSLFADKVRRDACRVEGDDKLACKADLEAMPLQDKTVDRVGNVITDKPGGGVEFHSLRDYHSSDPRKRIEWRHLAKTGALATKNFREEQAATIILLVDARPVSDTRAKDGDPTGIDMCTYAARRAYDIVLASRHEPGLAVLGVSPTEIQHGSEQHQVPYIAPNRSRKAQQKVKETLQAIDTVEKEPVTDIATTLVSTLPPAAQIVLFSPLLDDAIVDAVTVLDSYGFPVTVISPDITRDEGDPFNQLEALRRDLRVKRAQRVVPLVDWDIAYPLSGQLANTMQIISGHDIG